MRSLGIVGILLILVQTGDRPAIEVGEDRLLSVDGPERPLVESHLSADPNNANHLRVGVIQFDSPDGNNRTCVAWASFDSGQHWIRRDRKSTRLNSSHVSISYAVFCLKKKKKIPNQ